MHTRQIPTRLLAAAMFALGGIAHAQHARPGGASDYTAPPVTEPADHGGNGGLRGGMCTYSFTRSQSVSIPDGSAGGIGTTQDSMTTAGEPLQNIRVQLYITHAVQGDLRIRLRHEASGVEALLVDRPGWPQNGSMGFTADNFGDHGSQLPFVLSDSAQSTYDTPNVAFPGVFFVNGSWLPESPLAVFNGLTGSTTWSLIVEDHRQGSSGTLGGWTICADSPMGSPALLASGYITPQNGLPGSPLELRVQVLPAHGPESTGLVVLADLSGIGGSASQLLFDNGLSGDHTAGDNLFSLDTTILSGLGATPIAVSVSDLQGRQANLVLNLTVLATNNYCPQAIPLELDVPVAGDNSLMFENNVPACPGTILARPVWYRFVGNGRELRATLCGSSGNLSNKVLTLYAGTCDSLVCIGRSSPAGSQCDRPEAPALSFCSEAGQQYSLVVSGGNGPFVITLHDVSPCALNDSCASAVEIPVGSTITSTNVGMGPDVPCFNQSLNGGAWYWTMGNGRVLNITTCGPDTVIDTNMRILRGSCDTGVCLSSNPVTVPGCVPSNAQSIRLCTDAGVPYFIVVYSEGSTPVQGQFQISVLDESECMTNDTCGTARHVSIGESLLATNVGSNLDILPAHCGGVSAFQRGVWFWFTGNGNRLRVSTCGPQTQIDTRLTVFTGECEFPECVAFNNDAASSCTPSIASTAMFCSRPGQRYLALVSSDASQMAAFQFSITDEGPSTCFAAACCTGSDCLLLDPAACTSAGGTYLGYGTTCMPLGPVRDYQNNTSLLLQGVPTCPYTESDIEIDDTFVIGDMNVRVSWGGPPMLVSNTLIKLRRPNGLELNLLPGGLCPGVLGGGSLIFDNLGGGVTCTGGAQGVWGSSVLNQLNGTSIEGRWTIRVCNYTSMTFGSLSRWSIEARERLPNPCLPAFCPTDWCADGNNDVPDIFCFLNSWFAGDEAAQNFGGTPGVPAIFAFITAWFAAGVGPCTP